MKLRLDVNYSVVTVGNETYKRKVVILFKRKPVGFLGFVLSIVENAVAMAAANFMSARLEDLFYYLTDKEGESEDGNEKS